MNGFSPDTKLSENFTIGELVYSQTAAERGILNHPSYEDLLNLQRLVCLILQPLRTALKMPIHITSGYRSPGLNSAIGGSRNSDHMFGRAADIQVHGLPALALASFIAEPDGGRVLPFHQVIAEHRGATEWVHVSIPTASAEGTPKREQLTARIVNGKAHYTPGLNRA